MRSIFLIILTIATSLGLLAGGVHVASAVMTEPERHVFANLNEPSIWTTRPERVDREAQTFERLPALLAPNPVLSASLQAKVRAAKLQLASLGANDAAIDTRTTGSVGQDLAETPSRAHLEWCSDRYRSYDEIDNSYQPYSGGPRRMCTSPYMQREEPTALVPVAPGDTEVAVYERQDGAPGGSHEAWCHQRYASYRPSDNSYQPYDGPRRECLSPYF